MIKKLLKWIGGNRFKNRINDKPQIVLEEYNGEFKYYVIDLENAMIVGESVRMVQIFHAPDDYTAKSRFLKWIQNPEYFPKHESQYLLLRSL